MSRIEQKHGKYGSKTARQKEAIPIGADYKKYVVP